MSRREKPSRRHVYFIEAVGLRRFKIGLADYPMERLKGLQTASPAPLRLAATVETNDAIACEAWFHRRFADLRLHGEWFKTDPRLKRLMKAFANWPMVATFGPGELIPTVFAGVLPGREAEDMAGPIWNVGDVMFWPKLSLNPCGPPLR